jgi:protein-S-isoprenylcysteine O-methyltransferase Ste14
MGALWQSGPALLAAVVIAVFLNAKASQEERWLRDKFSEYANYQKRVSRLIPWVW